MSLPCFPNKKKQNRTSFIGDELHAFDLTWRNYIPSVSQLCCCHRSNRIELTDDDEHLIEPAYYNDQRLYRGEAIQHYIHNSRDVEFDSVLNQAHNITTRNPFGHNKDKKKKNKKKKNKLAVMETDIEEDITGYHVHEPYYDAEFLADDQIANLVHQQHDQFDDRIQEMQPPQFYAARTIPQAYLEESTSQPLVSVEAAQTLLSNKLEDLTEKLTFIKNNIIQIKPQEEDATTLHTIHPNESHISDIDSVTSEALDVYETTTADNDRYSTDELHLPSFNNTHFVSDQHPFTYFTQEQQSHQEEESTENNGINVFDMGRKWLGL